MKNNGRESLKEIFSKDKDFPQGMIGIFKTAEIHLLETFDKIAPTKEYLVSDPLTLNTRKEKRNLMISSSMLIIAGAYGLKDNAIPFLKVNDATSSVGIGIISLIVVYAVISYILVYSRDVLALYQTKNCLIYESFRYPLTYVNESIVRSTEGDGKQDVHIGQTLTILNSCRSAYRKVLLATASNYVHKIAGTIFWDFVFPVGIAFLGLLKSKSELLASIQVLLKYVL